MASNEDDTVEIPKASLVPDPVVMDSFHQHGVEIAATSHRGFVRSQNEDQYSVVRRTRRVDVMSTSLPDGELEADEHYAWLMAVADGLGGHVSGEVASAIAIKTILNFANSLSSWVMRPTDGLRKDFRERVELYAQAIQTELQSHAQRHPELRGMATTVTAAYLYEFNGLIVNLGDSRSYLLRNQSLRQITNDHTLRTELESKGLASEDVQMYRNVLTRCFNTAGDSVQMDIFHVEMNPGDVILLCTDGLTDMVPNETIRKILLEESTLESAGERLTQTALDAGGRDNITLVLSKVGNR